MKILVLGSDGMLGHVVTKYFEQQGHQVFGTTRKHSENSHIYYYDVVENYKELENILKHTQPDVVINCIGILNKFAEENHASAVLLNSFLPHYVDQCSNQYHFYFIHVSTDCVFSGKLGQYHEDSMRDAKSFYGSSKALGEINNDHNVTLRTSIVGPDINPNGIGLFKWFMDQDGDIQGYSKAIWSGVTTIQFAKAMEVAIKNHLTGLNHVVNNETINKYDLLCLFKKVFERDIHIIPNDSVAVDKSLVNTKNKDLFQIPSYEQMVQEMKEWVLEHQDLYPELVYKIGR